MKNFSFRFCILMLLVLLCSHLSEVEAKPCKPSGKIRGKKPPPNKCKRNIDSECCEEGKFYTIYKCTPWVTNRTKAVLTLNRVERGKDGGGPSECDKKYHSDDIPIVALSSGWCSNNDRCFNNITISGNGRKVAVAVEEWDLRMGCDEEHDYQPPCDNNIVDASNTVWKALGVPHDQWGGLDITWSDN